MSFGVMVITLRPNLVCFTIFVGTIYMWEIIGRWVHNFLNIVERD